MHHVAKRKLTAAEMVMGDPQSEDDLLSIAVRETRKLVSDLAPAQVYAPATKLFQQGSRAQDVYFINRGLVKLVRVEQGGRELIIDLRLPNWLLGAATMFLEKMHSVSAVTLSECHLHRIPGETFYELLKTNTAFSLHLHRMHSHEVLNHIARVSQLGCLSAHQRLENLLWQLTSALKLSDSVGEIHVQLPLKYWEVAQLIAVTPEYLCRLLKKMHEEGLIRQDKGWIVVTNFQRLWHQPTEDLS